MKKICLLDGNPRGDDSGFERGLAALVEGWARRACEVRRFDLHRLAIQPCKGCFNCWWKTPGRCETDDDSHLVRGAYVDSDLVVFASPLIRGFPSALLKYTIDKLIPLALPYIALTGGECMHTRRYEKLPAVAGLLQPESDTGPEDLALVSRYFQRLAGQFHSRFLFSRSIADPAGEVLDELDHL